MTALDERFWSKVQIDAGGCWRWTASHTENGYAQYYAGRGQSKIAHRFAYEALVGPVPDGHDLDHLCRVRDCVNPKHLEPVLRAENLRRIPLKSHCKWGHELTPENVRMEGTARKCIACQKVRNARWYSAPENRAKALAKSARRRTAAKENAS